MAPRKSPTFTAFAGIRNTLPAERLHALPTPDTPTCDLAEAVNVDVDNSGQVARRAGLQQVRAGAAHSLWADAVGWLFVAGTSLYRLYPDYSTEVLASGLTPNARMAYVDVAGRVYFANGLQSGVLAEGRVQAWGIDLPLAPGLAAISGHLEAGQYSVAVTFVRADALESGAGLPSTLTLTEPGGLRVMWQTPLDASIERVRVYLTPANGMTLYLAAEVDAADLYTEVTSAQVSLPLDKQWLDAPPKGQHLAYHRGRIWIAQDGFLFATPALSGYEYCDLRDFAHVDGSAIRVLGGVEHGLFVGTERGVYFLAGDRLEELDMRTLSRAPAVAHSLVYVDGATATGKSELAGQRCALFATAEGVLLGLPDGSVENLTKERYAFDAAALGAAGYRQTDTLNQYLLFQQT